MQHYITKRNLNCKSFYIFTSIIIIFTFTIINSKLISHLTYNSYNNNNSFDENNIKTNAFTFGTLSLTNPSEIDGKVFTLNSIISIKGRFYNKIPPITGYPDYEVELLINNANSTYTNITDSNGDFQINYIINPNLNLYSIHNISVRVTNSTPGDIENNDFYLINVNISSYFQLNLYDNTSIPKLTEEIFHLNGTLNYGNGTVIPNKRVNYTWLSGLTIISKGNFSIDPLGALEDVQVPQTTASYLTLKLSFVEPPYIDYSEYFIHNIKVFQDITWDLDIDYTVTEGDNYTLSGTLFSSMNSSLRINDREIEIYYNGNLATTDPIDIITASDGRFSAQFRIPEGNGTASLQGRLINSAGKTIFSSVENILVEPRPPPPISEPSNGLPPFLLFSLIFFPILAVIGAALGVYGFLYYKKREKESRVVQLPLESRIENLKILKDSGRLEESISYLYNAIYMDLINAKYNRKRSVNETIRDFAIISVKELKLTPSSIYPFIQKVEEIIYAKPFKILEQDFYNTCELFSPIYFQLTGYNFVLNF